VSSFCYILYFCCWAIAKQKQLLTDRSPKMLSNTKNSNILDQWKRQWQQTLKMHRK